MFRCAFQRSPSSLLADDCITAMAEGLSSSFYGHFLGLLWKDGDSAYLADADSSVSLEWDSLCSIIMQMFKSSCVVSQEFLKSVPQSSWEFLISSKFHKNYKLNSISGISSGMSHDVLGFSPGPNSDGKRSLQNSFYSELLMECLDSLHAVYEGLKLDIPRKRLVFSSYVYSCCFFVLEFGMVLSYMLLVS
jgi:anaphase-promoting complex subunit 1